MHSILRPLAVFTASSALSLAVLYVTGDDPVGSQPMQAAAAAPAHHDLARLRVLDDALHPVAESYVEPSRIDPERMFTAALEAVERMVPKVMFRREGRVLSAHVDGHRAVLEVPPLEDLDDMETQLRRVARLLQDHLDPDDVPVDARDLDPLAALEFAMGNGMLATLDPHSALLPPEQSRDMDVENSGQFGGLGINIQIAHDQLLVERALPGKPAARAGVRDGDLIRRIDGQSTINITIDEAVELLRGHVGVPVTLEVVREGVPRPLEIEVERASIKINEVEGYALSGGIGYVRIPSFHATVHRDLEGELLRLARQEGGLRGLVLDLRDNPGGYLNQAVFVADTFLADGEIVSTRGPRDHVPQLEEATVANTEEDYPMVVLVNASSASASEIVAGALRNNERAVIVGERTFGKGSVQNLHQLAYDSKLKITVAHYLTPGERSIQSVGIPADIELTPWIVGERDTGFDGRKLDALLHARAHVRREADLDDHLERSDVRDEQPAWRLGFVSDWDRIREPYGAPEPDVDPELAFALELIQIAPTPHRGDMLAAAAPLVARHAAVQDAQLVRAMRGLGVDWSSGAIPDTPDLAVSVELGDDGVLVAGEPTELTVAVTNSGEQALHRVSAVVGEHEEWEGLEFFLGRVEPGETRRWTRTVALPDGWPEEVREVPLRVRAGDGIPLEETSFRVVVHARPAPRLAWSWQVLADADGSIDAGDTLRLRLDLTNLGDGPSHGATGRIRNRSGKALDIRVGTIEAGEMVADDGTACELLAPGWDGGRVVGDADDPRVAARMAAEWADGCRRVLSAGATWSGEFEVEVLEPLSQGYAMELTIEDAVSYDHGALVRGGFYDYYRQEEDVRFGLGAPGPAVALREPPRIDLTHVPAHEVVGELATLSGRVSDTDGVDHVVVFLDEDKVFFDGSDDEALLPAVPFSADLHLDEGVHTVSVLARDVAGFSTARSHVIRRAPATRHAAAEPSRER